MIIICLLLLNIFYINSYTPPDNFKLYNLKRENKTIPIYTPHNSFKKYNLKKENRTTISTINNSLLHDYIYFHYLK